MNGYMLRTNEIQMWYGVVWVSHIIVIQGNMPLVEAASSPICSQRSK